MSLKQSLEGKEKIVSIVINNAKSKKLSLLSFKKKLKVGKSLITSVCRKKRKEIYDPTVLKKPKGGSLRAVVLKTTS